MASSQKLRRTRAPSLLILPPSTYNSLSAMLLFILFSAAVRLWCLFYLMLQSDYAVYFIGCVVYINFRLICWCFLLMLEFLWYYLYYFRLHFVVGVYIILYIFFIYVYLFIFIEEEAWGWCTCKHISPEGLETPATIINIGCPAPMGVIWLIPKNWFKAFRIVTTMMRHSWGTLKGITSSKEALKYII